MALTNNFKLREALKSSTAERLKLHNCPNDQQRAAIKYTAEQMELVRTVLNNRPILVSSWFRNEEVNKVVGGVPNSAHVSGYAVDFTCPRFGTVTEVCRAIIDSGIKFDQLIWEYGRWVHISFAPTMRQQVLHINGAGYKEGLPK